MKQIALGLRIAAVWRANGRCAAVQAGCDAYRLKPCLSDHLLKEVRTQLVRSSQLRA